MMASGYSNVGHPHLQINMAITKIREIIGALKQQHFL